MSDSYLSVLQGHIEHVEAMPCSVEYRASLRHVLAAARTIAQALRHMSRLGSIPSSSPALALPELPMLPEDGIDLHGAVSQFEDALIRQALERTGWNKNQAARALGMKRTTLVEKLKKREQT